MILCFLLSARIIFLQVLYFLVIYFFIKNELINKQNIKDSINKNNIILRVYVSKYILSLYFIFYNMHLAIHAYICKSYTYNKSTGYGSDGSDQ